MSILKQSLSSIIEKEKISAKSNADILLNSLFSDIIRCVPNNMITDPLDLIPQNKEELMVMLAYRSKHKQDEMKEFNAGFKRLMKRINF